MAVIQKTSVESFLTRSKGEVDLLGLDLGDFLWIHFPSPFLAIRYRFVPEGLLFPLWAFDHVLLAAPFYQRLQLVTAGRHRLALLQETLGAAAH